MNAQKYTERVVVLEQPQVVATLREAAEERGHSLGAEVRQAVRAWLASKEGDRQ